MNIGGYLLAVLRFSFSGGTKNFVPAIRDNFFLYLHGKGKKISLTSIEGHKFLCRDNKKTTSTNSGLQVIKAVYNTLEKLKRKFLYKNGPLIGSCDNEKRLPPPR